MVIASKISKPSSGGTPVPIISAYCAMHQPVQIHSNQNLVRRGAVPSVRLLRIVVIPAR